MKGSTKIGMGASRRLRSLLLAGALLVALQPAAAVAEDSTASNAGIGAASALCSLVYGPLKLVYATLGVVMGGMAWGLSGGDSDVMGAVLLPAVRGDYVVTPANLRGQRPLEFIGHRPGYGSDAEAFEEDY
jgi:hypothetical protein